MASKRIWNESILEWNRAGSELWNLASPFIRPRPVAGSDGEGEADWQDFEDEEKERQKPTIVISEWSPNLTAARKRILEIAGIPRKFFSRKETNEGVSIFITEVKFRNK